MGYIKCPHCGEENPEDAVFCGWCTSKEPLYSSARTYQQLVEDNKQLVEDNKKLGETIKKQDGTINQQGETIKKQGVTIERQGETIKKQDGTINQQGETIKKQDGTIRKQGATITQITEEYALNAKWKKIGWYALGVVLLCVLGVVVGSGVKNKNDKALMKEVVMLPSNIKDKLPGFYMLQRKSEGGNSEKLTSEIKEKDGVYGIRIVTDYGPEYHYFTVEGSNLKSETLGQGTIKYKQSVDKIILSFTSNNIVWEFVK